MKPRTFLDSKNIDFNLMKDHHGCVRDVVDVEAHLFFNKNIILPCGKQFSPKVVPCLYYGRYLYDN